MPRTRPTRSWLFTPGTRDDRFAKAAETGADVLIIDLEDAVSPDDKPRARSVALEYLAKPATHDTLRAVRINGLDTHAGIADLDALLRSDAAPDFLVLPKADSPGHLHVLDRLLTAKKLETRLVDGGGDTPAVRVDAGRRRHGSRSRGGDHLAAARRGA